MIKNTDGLKVKIEQQNEELVIHLNGFVDEDAEFSNETPEGVRKIIIDFENVKLITSCGLRTWVTWVKALEGRVQIVFRNCHRNIVDPINILEGFMPAGTLLESMYVPYACDSCDYEEEILYVYRRVRDEIEIFIKMLRKQL